jgi:hypothetical protein
MDQNKDYYAILGVLPEAEAEVIRAVYLALAKKYHPDSGGGAANEDRQKEINEAYEILNDPEARKAYDTTREGQANDTGDYNPDIDDENLTVDDFQVDWEIAVEYCPELEGLLKEVASISPTLSIVFQTTILGGKAFNDAPEIRDHLISSFFVRYFGNSPVIQSFAKGLLQSKKMAAAKELNKVVKVFGDAIDAIDLILKITNKYDLHNEKWPEIEYGSIILEYKNFGIYKHNDGSFFVSSGPNDIAFGGKCFSTLDKVIKYIEGPMRKLMWGGST